jgi:DUF1009 family protein
MAELPTTYSRFLPKDFNPQDTIALIAGRENYPVVIAERIRAAGLKLVLIAFKGETEMSLYDSFSESERGVIKVGQLGKMLKYLQKMGAKSAIMAGQVTPGKLFRGLHPDLKAIRILNSLKEKNAESIFGAIGEEMKQIGVTLLDARVFMDVDMASPGCMTGGILKEESDALAHGIKIAKEIARLDIGQGVVVRKGTVLAVEAFEGTNKMLERAGELGSEKMIFVKTVKRNQDYRFDVPVFGMKTLDVLKKAKIQTVALEVDRTIMLDKEAVLNEAKRAKIQIYGYTENEFAHY